MKTLEPEEAGRALSKKELSLRLARKKPDNVFIGFEEGGVQWHILGLRNIPSGQVGQYRKIFTAYFGSPRKEEGQEVRPFTTVPDEYIGPLNRMNGFLIGGIMVRLGQLSIDQVVEYCARQLGGCTDPIINLFTPQTFYGAAYKRREGLELVRISPHSDGLLTTIEYMFYGSPRAKDAVAANKAPYISSRAEASLPSQLRKETAHLRLPTLTAKRGDRQQDRGAV